VAADYRSNKRLAVELSTYGIPMSYRGEVWKLMIGNDFKITTQMFHDFRDTDYTFGRNSEELKESLSNYD
jgi:hypothetical protein